MLTGEKIAPEQGRIAHENIGYTIAPQGPETEGAISDRIFKTQRFMIRGDFTQVEKINLTPAEDRQLLELHIRWLQNATERELKSAKLTMQALGNGPKIKPLAAELID